MAYAPLAVTYDTVPLDEVEVRRGEHVHATDGRIGKVQGLVIDPDSHHVTHVLLQEGHLWGRKEVAIPIGAVTGTADGIQLNLTKRQVEDLPPVDIHHPARADPPIAIVNLRLTIQLRQPKVDAWLSSLFPWTT